MLESFEHLGIQPSDYGVLMLLPLVYVAWADGKMGLVQKDRIESHAARAYDLSAELARRASLKVLAMGSPVSSLALLARASATGFPSRCRKTLELRGLRVADREQSAGVEAVCEANRS
jgi:hypothetical protein